MKKLAIFSGLAIGIVTLAYLFLAYEPEMTYRESDKVRYHLYTPESIKQAPRLSPDYTFSHSAANGQPETAGVCFSGVSDAAVLKQYLVSRGYAFARKAPSGSYGRQNVIGMCTSLLSAGFRLAGKFAFLNQNVNLHLRRGLQESPATALTVNGWQAYRQQF